MMRKSKRKLEYYKIEHKRLTKHDATPYANFLKKKRRSDAFGEPVFGASYHIRINKAGNELLKKPDYVSVLIFEDGRIELWPNSVGANDIKIGAKVGRCIDKSITLSVSSSLVLDGKYEILLKDDAFVLKKIK